MTRKISSLTLLLFVFSVVGTYAHPTGAPLLSFPVIPCRILDTRVSLGPLAGGTGMSVHVRGSALLASEGAGRIDCDIPPEAEAVKVNVAVVSPTGNGYLKINAFGDVAGSHGPYSRLNYRTLETDSNEIQIDLCNIFLFPAPHEPCGFDGERYNDFQILNNGPIGSGTHIVADVVGYLARAEEE
jgi:hypothetical protein